MPKPKKRNYTYHYSHPEGDNSYNYDLIKSDWNKWAKMDLSPKGSHWHLARSKFGGMKGYGKKKFMKMANWGKMGNWGLGNLGWNNWNWGYQNWAPLHGSL